MPGEFDVTGVPPWGRGAEEYEAFFMLPGLSREARVLDCAAGPASFAAEWGRKGRFIVAADPIYARSGRDIAGDFEATAVRMLEGMQKARDRFNWAYYGSPERVVERRRSALAALVTDLETRASGASYVAARLPSLPFSSDSFDLVLCSHMLFLYSDALDLDMHVMSLREMLRIGAEVRVFPLLDMDGRPSAHLEPTLAALQSVAQVELVPIPFEFQRGGGRMLRVRRSR